MKMGIKINFFHGLGARRINAGVLNAQKLHCWGSDKDMIFAPTILTLLLLWCYLSLSTQTFRIKSDPKAAMPSALRSLPFPKRLSCIACWNCLPLSEISLDSIPSPSVCPELCPAFLRQTADELDTYKSITCICLWVCMYIFLYMDI